MTIILLYNGSRLLVSSFFPFFFPPLRWVIEFHTKSKKENDRLRCSRVRMLLSPSFPFPAFLPLCWVIAFCNSCVNCKRVNLLIGPINPHTFDSNNVICLSMDITYPWAFELRWIYIYIYGQISKRINVNLFDLFTIGYFSKWSN